jgi:hypothetical protein
MGELILADNKTTWRSINAIVDEIVRLRTNLHRAGIDADDQDDRDEVLDTLARIERKIKANGIKRQ